jgi:D-amino peptidase
MRLLQASALLSTAVLALPPVAGDSSTTDDGITLSAPAAHKDGELRVLVYHDMEGLAGQDDYRTFNFWQPDYYPKGQELLAADINAVVDGLFAGGATKVVIVDAHGSGNPEPDLVPAKLDKRATQLTRDAPFGPYVDIVAPNAYDAVVAVAMHAKTGSGGFASHTFTLGMDILMNGRSITETELVALSWGRVGVPLIFASGDDKLAKDLATMPWIRFVTTKKATSASTVELRDVSQVHAEMRAQAADAVRNLAQAKVMRPGAPIHAALRVVPPASLAMLRGVPGVQLSAEADRVEFEAKDFGAAYDGVVAFIGVATATYPSVAAEVLRDRADSAPIRKQQGEHLMMRWLDVESGRWKPQPATSPAPGRKYYGAS